MGYNKAGKAAKAEKYKKYNTRHVGNAARMGKVNCNKATVGIRSQPSNQNWDGVVEV